MCRTLKHTLQAILSAKAYIFYFIMLCLYNLRYLYITVVNKGWSIYMNTLFYTIECMLQIDLFLEATNLSRNTFNIWAIVQYQVTLTSSHFVHKHSPGGHWSSIHWRSTYLNVSNLFTSFRLGNEEKFIDGYRWTSRDRNSSRVETCLFHALYIFNRSISCRCPSLS